METRKIKSTSTRQQLMTATLYGSLIGLVVLFSLGNAQRSRHGQRATVEQMRASEAAVMMTSDTADQAGSQRQIPGHPELDLQLD